MPLRARLCAVWRSVYFLSFIAFVALPPDRAFAHCFVGARFFPATVASDDPCVADELSLPTFSTIRTPPSSDEPGTRERSYSFDFARRITTDFGIEIGRSFLVLSPAGMPRVTGGDNLEAGLKYQLFSDPRHEFVFSAGIDFDIGGTGARRVGAEGFTTITPQIYFGKGFGDLPEGFSFLKPFAVTGVVGYGIPMRAQSLVPGDPDPELERNPRTLNTALSLQYSLPYLQANVRDTGFGAVFNHLIPLVEFNFQTPLDAGQRGQTIGTINPGFIWAEKTYQFSVQAIIPANSRTGSNTGVIAQLHFYLDDAFPAAFGKPVFGGRP